jgi:hypothetical protein
MGVGKAETSKVRTEEGAGSVRPANGARVEVMKAVSARIIDGVLLLCCEHPSFLPFTQTQPRQPRLPVEMEKCSTCRILHPTRAD